MSPSMNKILPIEISYVYESSLIEYFKQNSTIRPERSNQKEILKPFMISILWNSRGFHSSLMIFLHIHDPLFPLTLISQKLYDLRRYFMIHVLHNDLAESKHHIKFSPFIVLNF